MTMTLVQSVTVGAGGAASIEWTGIPQTGKDLLCFLNVRGSTTAFRLFIRVNGDTGSTYSYQDLNGTGTATAATSGSLINTAWAWVSNRSDSTASTFSNGRLYIPNYTSSVAKQIINDGVSENSAALAYQGISAGSWSGTSAVTSFAIAPQTGTFAQYSIASLYIIS